MSPRPPLGAKGCDLVGMGLKDGHVLPEGWGDERRRRETRDFRLDKDDHGLDVATLSERGIGAIPIPVPVLHHGITHVSDGPRWTPGKEAMNERS